VADKGPQALETERKQKQITQQPVDNEAAQDGQRRAPDGDARADKGRNPQQKGDQRDL
jgi:hypothetical protein